MINKTLNVKARTIEKFLSSLLFMHRTPFQLLKKIILMRMVTYLILCFSYMNWRLANKLGSHFENSFIPLNFILSESKKNFHFAPNAPINLKIGLWVPTAPFIIVSKKFQFRPLRELKKRDEKLE